MMKLRSKKQEKANDEVNITSTDKGTKEKANDGVKINSNNKQMKEKTKQMMKVRIKSMKC